jgi:hypothetical protein
MPIDDVETARRKYKPQTIKFLFVAEAPPKASSGRFFYFENISDKDSLFLETMKVLYPKHYSETKIVRLQKRQFLERFRSDGFYLIDSCDSPMEDSSPSRKRRQIQDSLPSLRNKLRELATDGVKVILISATVYDECFALKREGFNIINDDMIDFPVSGGQAKFREKLGSLLIKHGWVSGT